MPQTTMNLTGHMVRLCLPSGEMVEIQPAETPATVDKKWKSMAKSGNNAASKTDQMPVIHMRRMEVSGIPDPSPGVKYIVAPHVLAANPGRTDVFTFGELSESEPGKDRGFVNLIANY